MPRRGIEPQWNDQSSEEGIKPKQNKNIALVELNRPKLKMTLVNTEYSIAPLWRSRIVSDSLIIPLGFDSSPGHKISNCGSPLTSSIDSLSAIAY